MRRITPLAIAVAAACASIQQPPGGPARTTPPVLVSVTPDSGAVNVTDQSVVFTFDEVVSDRPSGTSLLDNLFLVSPRLGQPDVSWKRSRIEVTAHKGFQPNTAYTVTMLPGIMDQRNNVLQSGRTITFSTGPTIPPYYIYGRAFDWLKEAPAPRAYVEAIRKPDSLTYIAIADSSGQFALGPMTLGTYTVRATIDANNNRALDRAEAWDTLTVTVRDTLPFIELLAAQRDTGGPRIVTATPTDSVTIAVSFDRPVDASGVMPARYRVVGADSVSLTILAVVTKAAATAEAAARAAADTTRRDSTQRRPTPVPIPPPLSPATPKITIKPSRPAPAIEVAIRLDPATPLRPGASYRLTVTDVSSLAGVRRSSERVFTMPQPSQPRATAPPNARP